MATSGQPVKRGTMAHDHDVYAALADIASQQRDAQALRVYAPKIEELALRDDHRLYRAIAHRAHGVLGRLARDYAEAATRYALALQLFEQLGAPWQAGRTHYEIGALAREVDDLDGARNHYGRALAAFEALRAAPESERARAILRELPPLL